MSISVVDSSESIIDKALNSDFTDFEDAIQYYTACLTDVKPEAVNSSAYYIREVAACIRNTQV